MACAAAAPSPCRAPARVLRQHAEPAQFPAHPPHPPAPRRPSLWGAKLCRRLLILILRRRLQAWSPRKQSPCGSSATQTSRAPRPSAAHDSSPCVPAAWAGPIVSYLPPQVCAARQVHALPGRLRFAAIVRHRLRCRAAGKATAAAPAAPPPPPPPPPPLPATAKNSLPLPCTFAGGLQLPSIIAALLFPPLSQEGHRAVRPPSSPPPPSRTPRRLTHCCLPLPSGTRCTCT